MAVDFVTNFYTGFKHLDVDNMAKVLREEFGACPYHNAELRVCPIVSSCEQCVKDHLLRNIPFNN